MQNTNTGYDGNGVVEFSEPVPFRLTRNLQTFFTPFFVEGLFVSSMCAAAQSIVAPKVNSFFFLTKNIGAQVKDLEC